VPSFQRTTPPKSGDLWTLDRSALAEAKGKVAHGEKPSWLSDLISAAETAMKHPAHSVTEKTLDQLKPVQGAATRHDYVSSSIDGQSMSVEVPDRANWNRLVADVRILGLAYYMTGIQEYADKASAMLGKWFISPDTAMAPNLQFAQSLNAKASSKPLHGGIIDFVNVPELLDGILLLNKGLPQGYLAQLQQWFYEYLIWLTTGAAGTAEGRSFDTHRTWYWVQVLTVAMFADQTETARQAAEVGRQIVAEQIDADGSQPYELAKANDALGYSAFNLLGLLRLAWASNNVHGPDLFNYAGVDGAGIHSALWYLLKAGGDYDDRRAFWLGAYTYPADGDAFVLATKLPPRARDLPDVLGLPLQ
jgi:hypothetical protein